MHLWVLGLTNQQGWGTETEIALCPLKLNQKRPKTKKNPKTVRTLNLCTSIFDAIVTILSQYHIE